MLSRKNSRWWITFALLNLFLPVHHAVAGQLINLDDLNRILPKKIGVEPDMGSGRLLLLSGLIPDQCKDSLSVSAITDLVGFYGVAPVAQIAGAGQAALTDNTIGTASTVLAALTGTYNSTLIVACIASLAVQGNAIRAALVSVGIIKGGA